MKSKQEKNKGLKHNTEEIFKELSKKIKPKIHAVMETPNGVYVQCDGELTEEEKIIVQEVTEKW